MVFFNRIKLVIKQLRKLFKLAKKQDGLLKKVNETRNLDKEKQIQKINDAKKNKNTKEDDERVISKLIIRKLLTHENNYLHKKMDEYHFSSINKNNYKKYCLGTRNFNGTVYSILSLYRITGGKRSDFKYIIVLKHTKSNKPHAKMRNPFNLYIDFMNEPYYGNYYRLFKNEDFLNKIWDKVRKLDKEEKYKKKYNN